MNNIKKIIKKSIAVKQKIASDNDIVEIIKKIADIVTNCFNKGGKVFFCGNGGSAADAQHLAAELSGKFYLDREPLFAEALHVNTSYLTAVANDYSYSEVFSRLVKAKCIKKDVLFCISTSGNSKNVLSAANLAKELGVITVGLTGENGGKLFSICDYIVKIPSNDTPRIQEAHILVGHIICEIVERKLFAND